MIPPKGFKAELYPLQHKVIYSVGLSAVTATQNSTMLTILRNYKTLNDTSDIIVNPHNTGYQTDRGCVVAKMSILDKLKISMRFNLTERATATDNLRHLSFLWRPIFFSFPEKLDAADDDTTTTVAAILQLTKDVTEEDVVPLSVNKLPTSGASNLIQPLSTVNLTEVHTTHYNMTAANTMEDVAWDEELFQDAIMRYTNKGALKACVGRTRHVHLTENKPFANFFFNKFLPRAVRRVMPYTFMAILIHVPLDSDPMQSYLDPAPTASLAHIGCKIICKYHEWNHEHFQDMSGAAA